MEIMKKVVLSIAMIATVVFTSCKNNEKTEAEDATVTEEVALDNAEVEEVPQQETITTLAMGNDNFSTLVAALKAADLAETLNSEGPFTVFAPTNDAFSKLPEGTVETLVKPENKEKLNEILTYHVVSGAYRAADVVNAINDNGGSFTIPTVQGGELTATLSGENVIITDANGNQATVVVADVDASNGVVHAIDAVLMPKE